MPEPPDPRSGVRPGSRHGGRIYFPGLDGLRAVAIGLVFIFHDRQLDLLDQLMSWAAVPVAVLVDPLMGLLGLPDVSFRMRRLVGPLRENGWIGVQLFFVLSGFLIAALLLRELDRFGRVDLRAFWARRALRIWPLYYLVVGIGFLVIPTARQAVGIPGLSWRNLVADRLPAFLVFLGNWSLVIDGPIPMDSISVLWSVCVEEQFYLFVPLLVAWCGPRCRVPIVVLLMLGAVACRYAMARAGVGGVAFRVNTVANLDALLAGVLLALLARRWPGLIGGTRWPWRLLVIGGGMLVLSTPLGRGDPWRMALDDVAIWLWGMALVAWAASDRDRSAALLRRPTMVWLGRISYGLYLYHEIALGIADWAYGAVPYFPEIELVFGLIGPALTVALASASYYGFERPFLRLKRRWTRVPSRPIDAIDSSRPGEIGPPDGTMAGRPDEPGPEPDGPRVPNLP